MKEQRNFTREALLDYAWSYFQSHATQRMSVFNFFVALAVLMTGALMGTFHKDFAWPYLGAVLGLGLTFVSFVFFKLDQRVKFLIKNAEEALASLEAHFSAEKGTKPQVTQLVRWEAHTTAAARRKRKRWSPLAQWSFAQAFSLLFWFFGLVGALGGALSIVRWVQG